MYRNLRDSYGDPAVPATYTDSSVTYETSTTAISDKDVRINLGSVPLVGARVSGGFYSRNNIYFNKQDTVDSISPYGALCSICHPAFHSTTHTGDESPYLRHPTEGVVFPSDIATRYDNRDYQVQVMVANNGSGSEDWTAATPSCMSCHKAHGNKNAFALLYMVEENDVPPDTTPDWGGYTEEGSDIATGDATEMPTLCQQCHSQGALY
jgi:hypothetical protein